MVSQKRLKEILHYDPNTGVFTWKVRVSNRVKIGDVAGVLDSSRNTPYIRMQVDSKKYFAHRLAWLYVYGTFPEFEIDHINRSGSDNRIANLRDVNTSYNMRNACKSINNLSGMTGVSWCKVREIWRATIGVNSKCIHLGYFNNLEAAKIRRLAANLKYSFSPTHGL